MATAMYSTKQASELTGASPQVIRQYTGRYARYFSTEATPEPGQPRRFTPDDVKLIRFIYDATGRQALGHEDVAQALESGARDNFEWDPPEVTPHDAQESLQGDTALLVPVTQLRAAQALLEDARQREQSAHEEAERLRNEINRLQRELGKAEGALQAYKEQSRPWWGRWFGRSR